MPIDNEMYFREDLVWWDEDDDSIPVLLRHFINPIRFTFFERAIAATPGARAGSLLDVGCGGGFLSEAFARKGFEVTGLEPSPHLVATARAHAEAGGLAIRYLTGYGEKLPFPDASFNHVACCDVLEHVDDLASVIAEIARVLKPGGLFLFDTINRTWVSWLFVIKIAQDWQRTAWEAPRTHVWSKLVKPAELTALFAHHGLQVRELRGIAPACNPIEAYRQARLRARGHITRREMARRFGFRESDHLSASYMGVARKAGEGEP
jgi:2-polyprenyl-6-hydroxyphenyl methylase / 3-demethylubiquinone-9 3-methyltransferase